MSASASDVRRELIECLQVQGREYVSVMEVLSRLPPDATATDPGSQSAISQLQTALKRAAAAETRLTAARQQYEQLGRPSSPELQQLLTEQESLLSRFVEQIDAVQNRFADARNRLLPQVDGNVRRQAMHSAYQRSLRTG